MILWTLFYEFFIIGLFTFGGGYAMIPLIQDVVTEHGWLTEGEFLNMLGISEVTPGPIAINIATYVGSSQGGFAGATLATLGVVLPAFIVILLVAMILKKVIGNKWVQSGLNGIKTIAVSLIFSSGIVLFNDLLLTHEVSSDGVVSFTPAYSYILIFTLIILNTFVMSKVFKRKINPIIILVTSAIIGILVNMIMP